MTRRAWLLIVGCTATTLLVSQASSANHGGLYAEPIQTDRQLFSFGVVHWNSDRLDQTANPPDYEGDLRRMQAYHFQSLRARIPQQAVDPDLNGVMDNIGAFDAKMHAFVRREVQWLPILTRDDANPDDHQIFETPTNRYRDVAADKRENFIYYAYWMVDRYGPIHANRPGPDDRGQNTTDGSGDFWYQNGCRWNSVTQRVQVDAAGRCTVYPYVRYMPIRQWEVWNEPHQAQFWRDQSGDGWGDPDAHQYAGLLDETRVYIRWADPWGRIVAGGGNLPNTYFRTVMTHTRNGVLLGPCMFDTVAIHPYAHTAYDSELKVDELRWELDTHGASSAQIAVNEIGYSVHPPADPAVPHARDAAAQADEVSYFLNYVYFNRPYHKLGSIQYFAMRDFRYEAQTAYDPNRDSATHRWYPLEYTGLVPAPNTSARSNVSSYAYGSNYRSSWWYWHDEAKLTGYISLPPLRQDDCNSKTKTAPSSARGPVPDLPVGGSNSDAGASPPPPDGGGTVTGVWPGPTDTDPTYRGPQYDPDNPPPSSRQSRATYEVFRTRKSADRSRDPYTPSALYGAWH